MKRDIGILAGRKLALGCAAIAAALAAAQGQEIQILSLSQNGLLTWTNSSLNVTCRVEWAPTVLGPWQSSWDSLSNIVITNHLTQRSVPMFYRVVCTCPPTPLVTNISASDALTLLIAHQEDTNFVVLDVRTPSEFEVRHIKGATNLNYYATDFNTKLADLNRTRTYLLHCASGGRSGRAADAMRQLGFLTVYNLLGGFTAFQSLAGAAPFLEP
jgi:rhodanese-related sulfurtransferase